MKPFSTFVAAGVQLYFVFSECPGSQTAFDSTHYGFNTGVYPQGRARLL